MQGRKSLMPSAARYPIFFLGLLIMIGGGLVGLSLNAPRNVEVVFAVVGFILIAISVGVR